MEWLEEKLEQGVKMEISSFDKYADEGEFSALIWFVFSLLCLSDSGLHLALYHSFFWDLGLDPAPQATEVLEAEREQLRCKGLRHIESPRLHIGNKHG